MKSANKKLSIVITLVLIVFTLFSHSVAQGASKPTTIPQIQFASAPVTEYSVGDRVRFNIYSPNYGGRVEYRVILWNDSQKTYYDLWNAGNGYPNRYYTKWQPYGNNIFTLGWPIFEPGYYRITVCVKRVGIPNNKTALKGMNCDSYMESASFRVKPKTVEVKYIIPIPDIVVKQGDIPVFPSTVRAVMNDGSEKSLKVYWNTVDTLRTGLFSITGNVEGTDKKAILRLVVNESPLIVNSISALNETTVNVILRESINFFPDISRFLISNDNKIPTKIYTLNLSADKKTVQLTTESMMPGGLYNLLIDGKDYPFRIPNSGTKVNINEIKDYEIEEGKSEVINISTSPEDAVISAVSSNEKAADVKINGNKLTVEGIDTGVATITVTAARNGFKSNTTSFKVFVNKLVADPGKIYAIEDFDETFILEIQGYGNFGKNIGDKNIILGGDLKDLEIVSVTRVDTENHKAKVRLRGKIVYKYGYGTFTVNSLGWDGSHSLTSRIEVELLRQVSMPTASPKPGEVNKDTQIVLTSSTSRAEIYYTTDGTTPTENSTKYTKPITIEKDVTIKAIAVKNGMLDSSVAVFNYTVKEQSFYLVRINPIDDLYIEFGTKIDTVPLPSEVEIVTSNGISEVARKVGVKWDTTGYNRNKVGIYNIKGSLILPKEVMNPNNIKASLKITVVLKLKTIKNIKANAAVSEPFTLPKTVDVIMSNDSVQKVNVIWKAPEGISITDGKITIDTIGSYQFSGTVNGYSGTAILDLEVKSPLKLGWNSNVTDNGVKTLSTNIFKAQDITFYVLPVQGVPQPVNGTKLIIEWDLPSGVTMDDVQILDNTAVKSENSWYIYKDGKAVFNITSKQSFNIKVIFKKPGNFKIKVSSAKDIFASLSTNIVIENTFSAAVIQLGEYRAVQGNSQGQNTDKIFIQKSVAGKWKDICITSDEHGGQLLGFFVVDKNPIAVISSIKNGLIIVAPGDNGVTKIVGYLKYDGEIQFEGYRSIQGNMIGENPERVYIQKSVDGKWVTLAYTVEGRGYEQLTGFFVVNKVPYAIIKNNENEDIVVATYDRGSVKVLGKIKWN